MTPEQTKAFAHTLYKAVTDITGGSWTIDGDTWDGCTPGHVQYSLAAGVYDYEQPDPAVLVALTEKVQKAWAARGIKGKLATDSSLDPVAHIVGYPGYIAGTDAEGASYVFQAQSNRLIITFDAPCVPGDLDKLNGVN